MRTLVWFRNDLRTCDNPALDHACERGEAVGCFFICADQWRAHDVGDRRLGFLLANLDALRSSLNELNIPLLIRNVGRFDEVPAQIVALADQVSAGAVCFAEEYPLNERVRDSKVLRACEASGLVATVHPGSTLLPPGTVLTNSGEPYTVFSAFKRRWLQRIDDHRPTPIATPDPQSPLEIRSSPLPRQIDRARQDTSKSWPAGETAARTRLDVFLQRHIRKYESLRDLPAADATSRLSPYLSIGALSPAQCLAAAAAANGGRLASGDAGTVSWINELIWRDFYRHVVALFPGVSRGQAFRPATDALPWRVDADDLAAWQAGATGYPLVDAAMRQLNETGWMHNRLRMVSAMFLAKHLLLDWRLGERYFMQQLIDGDFAANNGGWQWSASTGTDAVPYFRIFNPTIQAQRFDPEASFIKRFVPELRALTPKQIFTEPERLVPAYPQPIVDHRQARERAISAFKAL